MAADAFALIEREPLLQALADTLRRAVDGSGRVVVVSGEAGVGKTSLLREFSATLGHRGISYWGCCDALTTPVPLGPLQDMAARLDADLATAIGGGRELSRIFARLLSVLDAHPKVPILVFEDIHWADKATLDLIKFLGRRITSMRVLLMLSMRSDEIAGRHSVHRTLGEIPSGAVHRLAIAPLTIAGVAELAKNTSIDAGQLHRLTGGNPFFVSELIAANSRAVALPDTIRDAVHSRLAHIGRAANATLNAISIFPRPPTEVILTRMLGAKAMQHVDHLCSANLIRREPAHTLQFRHELARLAVLQAIPPRTLRSLHAKALDALRDALAQGEQVPHSQLVHHAAGAGDGPEVLRLAPLAAADAARVGAHAEATEHLASALKFVDLAGPEQAAELFETWSYEAALAVKIDDAIIEARHKAIKLWTSVGRRDKVGLNLRWLARLHWYRGEAAKADTYLSEALSILETLPSGPELAMAYAIRAQMLMLHRKSSEAITWGTRAIDVARSCGAMETLVHALNTVGTSTWYTGRKSGLEMLEESLARSLEHELHEQAARAYTNITSCALQARDYALAESYAAQGIKFDSEHDLDSWTHYLIGMQAQLRLDQGRLTEARDIADSTLRLENQTLLMRMPSSLVASVAEIRLSDDGGFERLESVLSDATAIGEPQYLVPARIALVEAAWLRGDDKACRSNLEALSELPLDRLNVWNLADVVVWFHRTDMVKALRVKSGPFPVPRQLEIERKHAAAGDEFLKLGMKYDAAVTLAHAAGPSVADCLIEAMRLFEDMGSRAGLAFVRRRAARLDISEALPRPKRGPYAKARSHPLGLTGREVQILRFVNQGLSNREISSELQRSERTIEHHMSAILGKLGVRNRLEALIRTQNEPWLLGAPET